MFNNKKAPYHAKKRGFKYQVARTLVYGIVGYLTFHLMTAPAENPYYNASKTHHTKSGFQNNYLVMQDKSFLQVMKWRMQKGERAKPTMDLQPVEANLKQISQAAKPIQVTWIGHSSALIQSNGLNILTDPILSDRASPVSFAGPKRFQKPGISFEQLKQIPIDVVLISHNHYDHLDLPTVRFLADLPKPPVFYVPLVIDKWFADNIKNAKTEKFDWHDTKEFTNKAGKVTFSFEPVQHWSARSMYDRRETLWGSWAMHTQANLANNNPANLNSENSANKQSIWFSGDLGYSKDIENIAKKYPEGFDVALIAIGAYLPRWFMKNQHIDPEEALKIHQEIKAKHSIGIHWGTFEMADEAVDQGAKDLEKAKQSSKEKNTQANTNFIVLKHGETKVFE